MLSNVLSNKVTDIELELSTYCNADCPLCYRNYNTFDEHYSNNFNRDYKELINQIDSYPDLEWIRLVGSISEPTLYPEFLNLIEYIKNKNIKIEICTNGSTRDVFWWESLGNKLSNEDSVYFTICGSTQELHETYRTGTNLEKILKNVNAFQKYSNVDYAQCIRFDYNDENFNSPEFKKITDKFSNVYMTETFLLKDFSNYVNKNNLTKLKPFQGKIAQYITIEKIANLKWAKGLSKKRTCKAYNENRLQIDVNGNEYPCYLFLEASNGKPWDKDWQKILDAKYECCKFCDKDIVQMCDDKDLDFII